MLDFTEGHTTLIPMKPGFFNYQNDRSRRGYRIIA